MPRCAEAHRARSSRAGWTLVVAALIAAATVWTGCVLEVNAIGGADDGGAGVRDGAGDRRDARVEDATVDSSTSGDGGHPTDADAADGGFVDAGTDAGVPDAGPPFCDRGDSTLSLCLRFEDDLVDDSATGHSVRAAGHTFATGRVGRGLSLSGGSDVWVSQGGELTATPFTIELWVRPRALPSSGRTGIMDLDGEWGVFIYPGGDVACRTAIDEAIAADVLEVGTTTHVACVFSGSEERTYIDGTLRASRPTTWSGNRTTGELRLGGNAPSGDDFDGIFDELRIFTAARSDPDIAAAAAR